MKIAVLIARILLGLEFAFFGLNGFLHFLKAPPPPGVAGQFVGAIFVSHYSVVIFGLRFDVNRPIMLLSIQLFTNLLRLFFRLHRNADL